MSKPNKKVFELKIITEPYIEKSLEFLREYYYKDEPMNQYLDSKRGQAVNISNRGEYLRNIFIKGLSVIAVTSCGEIIGISVNDDEETLQPLTDHPNIPIIRQLVRALKAKEKVITDEKTKIMYAKIMAVHTNWRNEGIGQSLFTYTRQLAKQNGFSHIKSICSNEYAIRMSQKQGFECIAAIKYEDFKEDGVAVFKPPLPHTHIISTLLKL